MPDDLVLTSEFSPVAVHVDPLSGLPVGIALVGSDIAVALEAHLRLVTGGDEVHPPLGGLDYAGCLERSEIRLTDARPVSSVFTDHRVHELAARLDEWPCRLIYTFRSDHPRVHLAVELEAPTAGSGLVRNLHLDLTVHVENPHEWLIHCPGNHVRPNLSLADFTKPVAISPAGGLMGSSGLVALERQGSGTFLWWPFSRQEIGDTHAQPAERGPRLTWRTDLAGEVAPGARLRSGDLHLDLFDDAWSDLLPQTATWLRTLGVIAPTDHPEWVATAKIFEVQIGYSVFSGYEYAPYPTAADLLADLPRIEAMGFNTIQVMPRQPFPSYNVHDYRDISTSWGDETVLRELVTQCHQRDMHLILDILLHGVVDKEAVARAADGVRNGPYAARIAEATPHLWSDHGDAVDVAYSRHIIDFEPHWSGGAPDVHPLTGEHPEWFARDSSGAIIGVYTKAFDVANPSWQQYFIDSSLYLIETLDIDGFRFDAPTYNYFANWSDRTRAHASLSMLGCIPLFRHLRTAMKALKPEAMLYTEPSGVLLRESMDLNYNYDEQWLFSVLEPEIDSRDQGVRNAKDLAHWLRDRDLVLPQGSMTAHHIDSHDTFWWPLPGEKWLRDRYGADGAAALLGTFALSGGPFMMFVGGEQEIEDHLRQVNRLRDARPELAVGRSDYDALTLADDTVYGVVRIGVKRSLVLVNLSSRAVRTSCSVVVTESAGTEDGPVQVADLFQDELLAATRAGGVWSADLDFRPYQVRVLALDS